MCLSNVAPHIVRMNPEFLWASQGKSRTYRNELSLLEENVGKHLGIAYHVIDYTVFVRLMCGFVDF